MTTHKVVVDLKSRPKGELVEVLYLGMFENGATHDLTDEQVATYEAVSGNEFPKSGYLFTGTPHTGTPAQQEAFDKNQKEGFNAASKGFDPSSVEPTQIDAHTSSKDEKIEGGSNA